MKKKAPKTETKTSASLSDKRSNSGLAGPDWQWVIREIDRCAYGRREKKPTKIMTNRSSWHPKGRTGDGRCKAGKCTGWLTSSGQTEHPGQTCPNRKEKKLDTGEKEGGRCERAQKAVKNALEEELIAEMYEMVL